MKIRRASLKTCARATDTVVVIDVLRAFSTAAYAFAAGAQDITLVRTVEEALALRVQIPGALVMGEVRGLPVAGFDFGNSPTQFNGQDLTGRRMIQRTSAGTQGVVLSSEADTLLASSFVCARATANYIHALTPESVTFVITGVEPDQPFDGSPIGRGDEDAACADYLEALLRGQKPDPQPFIRRVWESPSGRLFADPTQPNIPITDLEHCTQLDRFDFTMLVERHKDMLVMIPI